MLVGLIGWVGCSEGVRATGCVVKGSIAGAYKRKCHERVCHKEGLSKDVGVTISGCVGKECSPI